MFQIEPCGLSLGPGFAFLRPIPPTSNALPWRRPIGNLHFDPSTRPPAMAGGHPLGIPPENRGPVLSKRSESKDVEDGATGLPAGLHPSRIPVPRPRITITLTVGFPTTGFPCQRALSEL